MIKKNRQVSNLIMLTIAVVFTLSTLFSPEMVLSTHTTNTITHMSDTTRSTSVLTFSGRQINAELVTPTSQLIGDNIDSITLRLHRVGSPTGTANIGVFDANLNIKQLFGTVNVSTLPTKYQDFEFKLANFAFYTIQSGDRIGIQFTGGSSSSGVNLQIDTRSQEPFDGISSHRTRHESSWINSTTEDVYMILRWTPQDITHPTVSSVSSPTANGTYGVGTTIPVTVTFNEPVIVTGTPRIQLETGAIDRQVNYSSGSGTNTLTFNYLVQTGDSSLDLNYVATNSLTLNGGTIRDLAFNDAVLTLPATGSASSLGGSKAIVIDTTAPTVSSVSSPTANGTYGVGTTIPVTVTFNEPVVVTGIPQLQLETGTVDRQANYASGSGTNTLTFNYLVQAGDSSLDLNYVATNSLTLNGGTITDAVLNNAVLTLPATGSASSLGGSKAIVIDTTAPTLVLSTTASDPTNVSPIPVTATFSENVTGFVLADITVTNGVASNLAGGPSVYTFDVTPAGQGLVSVDVGAGVAQDTATNGNTAATTLNRTYDGTAPTLVLSTTASDPTNVSPIPVTATFSENVTGFVLADITVTNGVASNLAGGPSVYTFDVTPAGQGLVSVDVGAGVAEDSTGNGNNAAATLNRTYDGTAPTVSSVSSPTANGTYGVGSTIPVTVTFTEAVFVTGTPQLQLETGTVDRQANYASGSGTTVLTFNYVVQTGDSSLDLDYVSTTSLALNGGTVRDTASNNAVLTLPATGSAGSLGGSNAIVIDTTIPTPTANNQSVNTNENNAVLITLSGSDPEGDPLSFYTVSEPSNGVLSLINPVNNQIWYTPWDYFDGPDSFTFIVSDGETDSAPATVSINVVNTTTDTTNRLLVISILENWDTVTGYFTNLLQGGVSIEFGFTPAEFDLNNGQQYTVEVSDFGNVCFDHWLDTGSTSPTRDITTTGDTLLTAVYREDPVPCP